MYSQMKTAAKEEGKKKVNEKTEAMLQQKLQEKETRITELESQLSKLRCSAEDPSRGDRLAPTVQEAQQPVQNGISTSKDVSLFDPEILRLIDMSKSQASYNPPLSPSNPGENLIMRPLQIGDYEKGYLELLKHLTTVGDISREQFEVRFMQMKNCPESYYVTVLEDTQTKQLIGSATLVTESKFIHSASARGRVEDVVVNNAYRGKQLGKLLVDCMTLLSLEVGCYKVSLECHDPLVKFYSQFGFIKDAKQNYMLQKWWE